MMEKDFEKYCDLVRYLKTKSKFLKYNEKTDRSIFECLNNMIEKYNIDKEKVDEFYTEYYEEKIASRQNEIIYQQPMIIIIYILAKEHLAELEENWCFTEDMLEMVFSDLGISSNSNY